MSKKALAGAIATFALLLATFMFSMVETRNDAFAAPNAAGITPVSGQGAVTGGTGQLVPLVTAAVTADARVCKDFRNAKNLDIQTVVEWAATPDTVTIILEHSNDGTNFTDGQPVVATVVANTDVLNRYDQYGVYTCANINVGNPSATNYPNVKMLVLPHE